MLRDMNIMDYSLLLAIESTRDLTKKSVIKIQTDGLIQHKPSIVDDVPAEKRIEFSDKSFMFLSYGGRYIYHISIIDYL